MDHETRQALKRLGNQLDRIEARVYDLARGQRTLSVNQRVLEEQATMNAQDALDKIKANTDILRSIDEAANVLEDGQANIKAAIDKIKADNPAVDFTEIESALAEQEAVIGGIAESIPAGTPSEVPVEGGE